MLIAVLCLRTYMNSQTLVLSFTELSTKEQYVPSLMSEDRHTEPTLKFN